MDFGGHPSKLEQVRTRKVECTPAVTIDDPLLTRLKANTGLIFSYEDGD